MSEAACLVTVGIPSFQGERFIAEAIASALAQEVDGLEVMVADDASDDRTVEIARGFDDPRLRVLTGETNLGASRNWNRVLDEARGRYVKVMGHDDVLLPGSLAAEVASLEADPEVVLVTGPRVIGTERGRRIMRRGNGRLRGKVSGGFATREIVRSGANLIGEPCAVLMRASAANSVGGFAADAPYSIDLELWLRLLEQGSVYVLDEPVAMYRIVSSAWSTQVSASQAEDVVRLLRKTRERRAFDVTDADVERGARRARGLAGQRRLLYRVLFDRELHQQLRYLLIGGWNTLFGWIAFSVLYLLLHAKVNYAIVFVAAYAVSMANAYVGYKYVVFRTSGALRKEIPRFALVYIGALAVNLAVFPWLTRSLGLNPYLSQAIFTVALVICTYVLNKRFSFRQEARA